MIWIRNWLGLLRVWRIQALHDKKFKTKKKRRKNRKEKKKSKTIYGISNTCHRLLFKEWIDGRYWSLPWCAMLTKVMNSTKLWFRVVLASNRNILSSRLYWPEPQHPWFKTTKYTWTEEPLKKIPTLESSYMLQNWNLIER